MIVSVVLWEKKDDSFNVVNCVIQVGVDKYCMCNRSSMSVSLCSEKKCINALKMYAAKIKFFLVSLDCCRSSNIFVKKLPMRSI